MSAIALTRGQRIFGWICSFFSLFMGIPFLMESKTWSERIGIVLAVIVCVKFCWMMMEDEAKKETCPHCGHRR
jgi:hypothetical protein